MGAQEGCESGKMKTHSSTGFVQFRRARPASWFFKLSSSFLQDILKTFSYFFVFENAFVTFFSVHKLKTTNKCNKIAGAFQYRFLFILFLIRSFRQILFNLESKSTYGQERRMTGRERKRRRLACFEFVKMIFGRWIFKNVSWRWGIKGTKVYTAASASTPRSSVCSIHHGSKRNFCSTNCKA